jgi:hypothetical protein
MQQQIGGISPDEAAITRLTASIALLRVMSDAHPLSLWPGGVAVPMHTGIDFWQSNSGYGGMAGLGNSGYSTTGQLRV